MNKCYIFIALLLLLSLSFQDTLAQQTDSSKSLQYTVQNVLYFEIATMLIAGNFSLNIEHSLNENWWVRLGYGYGEALENSGHGPMLMVMYLTGYISKLEFGLGASYTFGDIENKLFPSFSIGYRYQPPDGGLLYRIGLTLDYRFGFPVEFSIGYAF